MKTVKDFKIVKSDTSDFSYSQCWEIVVEKMAVIPLNAGTSDHVHVFFENGDIYVLSLNYRLEYVGLELWKIGDSGEWTMYDEVFVQSDYEFSAIMDDKPCDIAIREFFDYSPLTMAKILQQYMGRF